ncbi:unnamed protein product [Clonostachys rosea f. rosea IK726]|uniref:Uncharacterized protein n=2 Tax=Bionectria ochroleuca TaxID=29856 RepID=A0ACA9UNE9_BIOOC|nr:unnamed protein product [Clonostachys rosea f. rosea IK726]
MNALSTAARADTANEASWSNIPTNLLLAELQRRNGQANGGAQQQKPECGSRDRGWYDMPAHVFALFLILIVSTFSCGFPIISRRTASGGRRKSIIFYCQHIGTGVLLATAFVHLLPMAFDSLTDPCLPDFFIKGYRPLPGFISLVAAILVVGVESYLTARGAGHSHSHHEYWEEGEEGAQGPQIQLQETTGLSRSRAGSHRPGDLSLGDSEAQGLVAGVSPLPESTPTGQNGNAGKRKTHIVDDSNDEDSDLDLDMDELDPTPIGERQNGQYASLNRPRSSAQDDLMTPNPTAPMTAEEQHRQVLQCLLLEAGILFHSVFIGMAVSVATGPAFVVFLVAISFHQCFEGLALGSRIAAIQFPKRSIRPWLMVLAYGLTTPIGQAIGLIVHKLYDPQSMAGLLVVGFMNAISSGLLLYAGLVQLLAEDFLTEKSYKVLKGSKRLRAYLAVCCGALMMAIVGAFA